MGVVGFSELLAGAGESSTAVGAFTCYDLVTGSAVLAAAKGRGVGVILLVSASAARAPSGPGLLRGLRELAEQAPGPCCLQLDHCAEPTVIQAALAAGAGAVMADGSQLSDEGNAELVCRAVDLAASYGAAVEAELGHVAGDEELAHGGGAGTLTDPLGAQRFVAETGAQCLAVSIGNVHGRYRQPPRLDFARLSDIRQRVPVPLALHGASGLADGDLRQAIAAGICKVNINQELRSRWFASMRSLSRQLAAGAELLALQRCLADDLQDVVAGKLEALAPARAPAGGQSRGSKQGEKQHG